MTYECCDKERNIIILDLLCVFPLGISQPFHFENEVWAALSLPVGEDQEEVDSDASHKRTEIPTAKVELLIRSVVAHYLIILITK